MLRFSRAAVAALLVVLCLAQQAWAQSVNIPPCNVGDGPGVTAGHIGANYSATVGTGQTTLIPAAPYGVQRTGIFIELVTASATLGINPGGGTASTTAAGNIVITTGASAPSNVASFNFSGLGFMPNGAVTVTADSTSRVVTAFACPQ